MENNRRYDIPVIGGNMPNKDKTISVKEFKKQIEGLPDNANLIFGTGDLAFYRVKRRGENLYQIEFNEIYEVISPEK
jgi:hypothetical protein